MFVNDSVKSLISTLTGAHKELIFLQNINIYSFFPSNVNYNLLCAVLFERTVYINVIYFYTSVLSPLILLFFSFNVWLITFSQENNYN